MRKCIWFLVLETCLALIAVTASQAQSRNLEIYWIDVEGGAATLIVTPSGQSLLVGAGWPGDRDPKRIAATAKAAGLTKIDILVTTTIMATTSVELRRWPN